jgi:tRNA(fMet)-specific endonuclease VapC
MNGQPPAMTARVADAIARRRSVAVSTIALFELWYGVGKSTRADRNAQTLRAFLSPLRILLFDDEDARIAGNIRAALEQQGKPIGPYDLLIAGQAIQHDLLLITANVREFSRVPGLRWEDWTLPP